MVFLVYVWDCGAWVSGHDPDLPVSLAGLVAQFGPPDRVRPSSVESHQDFLARIGAGG